MLLDKSRFAVAAFLEEHFDTFWAEADALSMDDLVRWRDSDACTKPWFCSPLFTDTPEAHTDIDFDYHRSLTPRSMELLEAHPKITMAGLSILLYEGHIHSHVDVKEPGTVRAHLPLQVPNESGIRLGGQLVRWTRGEAMVIEGGIDHEAANLSMMPRIMLLVDFTATAEEWAYIESEVAKVDPRWFVGGVGEGLFTNEELASGEWLTRELPADLPKDPELVRELIAAR